MAPKGKKEQNAKQRNTEEEVEEPLQAVVCRMSSRILMRPQEAILM